MRKGIYYLVVLLFSANVFVSCSSDDDNGPSSSADLIIGKWQYYKTGEVSGSTEILFDYVSECEEDVVDFIEFGSNNYFADRYHRYDCTLTTVIGTYQLNGNTLEINENINGIIYNTTLEVKILNDTTLKTTEEFEYNGEVTRYVTVYNRM